MEPTKIKNSTSLLVEEKCGRSGNRRTERDKGRREEQFFIPCDSLPCIGPGSLFFL
jgi:hypothetical protein